MYKKRTSVGSDIISFPLT